MRKQMLTFILMFVALVALVFFAIVINGMPAEAHAQIYPHVHPHPTMALFEDFLLNGVWLAIWAGIYVGGRRIVRAMFLRGGK